MTQDSTETTKRLHALVVEDSPPMRKMIVFALSRIKGLVVAEADDGVDALRRLASTKYDLIITDINMPILDGLKLVKRLRADEAYMHVPIIIITTEGAAEDRQRASSASSPSGSGCRPSSATSPVWASRSSSANWASCSASRSRATISSVASATCSTASPIRASSPPRWGWARSR